MSKSNSETMGVRSRWISTEFVSADAVDVPDDVLPEPCVRDGPASADDVFRLGVEGSGSAGGAAVNIPSSCRPLPSLSDRRFEELFAESVPRYTRNSIALTRTSFSAIFRSPATASYPPDAAKEGKVDGSLTSSTNKAFRT